jgi:hypothetical protein
MTGWPLQQASSAMTMRAGQPAQAAEHRGPGVAAGLRRAGADMSSPSCIGTAGTKSLWGRSPQGLHGRTAAEAEVHAERWRCINIRPRAVRAAVVGIAYRANGSK